MKSCYFYTKTDRCNDWTQVCFHQEYWSEIYRISTNLSVSLVIYSKMKVLTFTFKYCISGDCVSHHAPHKYIRTNIFMFFSHIFSNGIAYVLIARSFCIILQKPWINLKKLKAWLEFEKPNIFTVKFCVWILGLSKKIARDWCA